MIRDRRLKWDGCNNVRDLSGLSTFEGRVTRWGAVVRSDAPSKLTPEGWDALLGHGIRTIITLRTEGKIEDELIAANLQYLRKLLSKEAGQTSGWRSQAWKIRSLGSLFPGVQSLLLPTRINHNNLSSAGPQPIKHEIPT
jgi:hypothetical protein